MPKTKTKTMEKRALKKLLDKFCRGHVSSMRFAALKAAKDYAKANGLEFPSWAQDELRAAARETLAGAINFEKGNGHFI